jgi:hypothetical protein
MGATSSISGSPVHGERSAAVSRRELGREDKELVELVSAVLASPELRDDARLHLHDEINQLLRATHEDVYAAALDEVRGAPAHEQHRPAGHDPHVAKLLEAMLVDPSLHTSTRMRLYHEIPRLVETVRDRER